ncbi:MAG: HD domain-containing protein [Candidatus Paceibacterota bacterium]|jgi:tRNA nucleotidyltransferase/poly(A) polymerase
MNNSKNLIAKIPPEVSRVTDKLEKAGFQTYLVGGCVRDLLMDREPKDWDITTNAKPEEIMGLFEKTVYENSFGTVAIINEGVSQETLRQIEVTPYRIEAKYSDFRHPDEVKFSDKLEDDLKRRDFAMNALAIDNKGQLVDLYKGQDDIKNKVIRTVGEPDDRFQEDALRMLRAIRFSVQLDFSIAHETSESILKNSELIKKISQERIRDEFVKIIMSKNPATGILLLQKFNLLKYIIPELEEGINCQQSGEHIYDVFNHLLHALQHSADKNWPLEVRLSALFHDIGKPKSRRFAETDGHALRRSHSVLEGQEIKESQRILLQASPSVSRKKLYTFYGHEVVSARMTKKILERLKFSKKEIELVEKLIRSHMFFSDTEQITLSAVRRIITKVGKENIWSLMNVRECDRVGMKKKEAPYRLRKYFAMIEEALHDPISVGQLKINGEDLKDMKITPGPRMGWILHALLEEVLEDPKKNTKEKLTDLVEKLNKLSDKELRTLGEKGKEKKEELEEKEIEKLHQKHNVKK